MGRKKEDKIVNVSLTIQANQGLSQTDKENLIDWANGLVKPLLYDYKEGCLVLKNDKHGTVVIGWEPNSWGRKKPEDAQIHTEVKL